MAESLKNFRKNRELKLGIVLSYIMVNMVVDEIKGKVTGPESELAKIMVCIAA
jgi:hypothetical protein